MFRLVLPSLTHWTQGNLTRLRGFLAVNNADGGGNGFDFQPFSGYFGLQSFLEDG